jgi:hypothetical protein
MFLFQLTNGKRVRFSGYEQYDFAKVVRLHWHLPGHRLLRIFIESSRLFVVESNGGKAMLPLQMRSGYEGPCSAERSFPRTASFQSHNGRLLLPVQSKIHEDRRGIPVICQRSDQSVARRSYDMGTESSSIDIAKPQNCESNSQNHPSTNISRYRKWSNSRGPN